MSRAARFAIAVRRRVRSTTDKMQLLLAALWLLDSGLQLQPAMFTRRFATKVILPAASGQPGVVAGPIRRVGKRVARACARWPDCLRAKRSPTMSARVGHPSDSATAKGFARGRVGVAA
jgi:hypothetical protein